MILFANAEKSVYVQEYAAFYGIQCPKTGVQNEGTMKNLHWVLCQTYAINLVVESLLKIPIQPLSYLIQYVANLFVFIRVELVQVLIKKRPCEPNLYRKS